MAKRLVLFRRGIDWYGSRHEENPKPVDGRIDLACMKGNKTIFEWEFEVGKRLWRWGALLFLSLASDGERFWAGFHSFAFFTFKSKAYNIVIAQRCHHFGREIDRFYLLPCRFDPLVSSGITNGGVQDDKRKSVKV